MHAGTSCVYNETADRRRKLAERRTAEKLARCRNFISNLLETIRLGESDQVIQVVRALQQDQDLKTIASIVRHTRERIRETLCTSVSALALIIPSLLVRIFALILSLPLAPIARQPGSCPSLLRS
jgi:hypothetical protein